MPYYRVEPVGEANGDAYWVDANSEGHARELVALNVPEARLAIDPERFDCFEDGTKMPPPTLIFRRLRGPATITHRIKWP
jgi:hypothetical protein